MDSCVVYYNDGKDLMDRLELLIGFFFCQATMVSNRSFHKLHILNKLGVITNGQLNDSVKEYVIYKYTVTEIIAFFFSE